MGHLEYVKTLKEPGNNNIEEASCFEGDFHPSSESSRLSEEDKSSSISTESFQTHSGLSLQKAKVPSTDQVRRVSVIKHTDGEASKSDAESPRLPPQSPRILVQNVEENDSKSFFHGIDIDQLPIRNSPVSEPRRAPLIKLTRVHSDTAETPVSSCSDLPLATPKSRSASDLSSPLVFPYLPASLIINASPHAAPSPDISSVSAAFAPCLSLDLPPLHPSQAPTPVLPSIRITQVQEAFSRLRNNLVTEDDNILAQLTGVSSYLASTIHRACYGEEKTGNCIQFINFLQSNAKFLHQTSEDEKMFFLLSGGKNHLVPRDFRLFLTSFISTHPHLSFFRRDEYLQLHEAYITAILASMFYSVGAWRTEKMYLRQFMKMNLSNSLQCLDDTDDDITFNFVEHFSYDQFYVFYVKFVHLDVNNNNVLSKDEFIELEDGRFPSKTVHRIYELNVRDQEMSFWEWVVFILADIDKTTAMSVEFWFPVLNVSDDGFLTLANLKEFYMDNLIHLIAGVFVCNHSTQRMDDPFNFIQAIAS